ncbi:hypothetical protein Tco_1203347 [Tanacetum coccineum]
MSTSTSAKQRPSSLTQSLHLEFKKTLDERESPRIASLGLWLSNLLFFTIVDSGGPVSAEGETWGTRGPLTTYENRVDNIHPDPIAAAAFLFSPAAGPMQTYAKAENALLRARIKTTEAIEKITRTVRDRLVLRLSIQHWQWFKSPSVSTKRGTLGNSRARNLQFEWHS